MLELYRTVADAYGRLSGWTKIGLVAGFIVITTALALGIIVWLPADHFRQSSKQKLWANLHPVLRFPIIFLKNALGVVLLPLGFVMVVGPGPGLVVLVIGLSLLDFPGKSTLERKLLSRPTLMRSLNDLRAGFGRPPLIID